MRTFLLLLCGLASCSLGSAAERPNIVWLLSEDNSKHFLQLFDPHGAETPAIEKLAAQGLKFRHAFSCSPVCSVARTTLMSGIYAPRIGTHFHRKIKPVRLPEGWRLFPAYLREAGYYTTNNRKKDYNLVEKPGVWDESSGKASWRNRPEPETPFFHMASYAASHESSLHFSEKKRQQFDLENAETAFVPPHHPNTELFRETYAYYHTRIKVVDDWVGKIVGQLEQDGLLEDTFIFYFGDHGGVLPGSKGYLRETGLHVPLVVRIPENWKHLVAIPAGKSVDGFVSFIDFAPTVLHLASVEVPEHFDGEAFLGKDLSLETLNQRDEAFGYADRFDEKYDQCRSLRKGKYKYIRNYQAFYPDALQNNYRYRMLAYQQWREYYHAGKLNEAQRRFFEPKPPEELYDLEAAPYETNNLADDPEFASVLKRLRHRLTERLQALPDLSFYPETVLVEQAVDNPIEFAKAHQAEIAELMETADLCLLPFAKAEPRLRKGLHSENAWQRYWAVIACSVFGKQALSLQQEIAPLLEDENLLVRLRAAEFFGIVGTKDPRPTLYGILKQSKSPVTNLLTLNTIVFLQDGPREYEFEFSRKHIPAQSSEVNRRLEYLGW